MTRTRARKLLLASRAHRRAVAAQSPPPPARPLPRPPAGSSSASRRASRRIASSGCWPPRRAYLAALRGRPRRPARRRAAALRAGRDALRKRLNRSSEGRLRRARLLPVRLGRRRRPTTPSTRSSTRVVDSPSDHDIDAPERLGHPHGLRQGRDPRHRHRHRPPGPQAQHLQERRQAEQQQGRRQERLRRRHLRLERDRGQGLGRGRQRPRHATWRASSPGAATTTRACPASAGRRADAGQVHELEGQGLDVGRDRRDRVRRQAGRQDHQLLVRVELEVAALCTTPSTTPRTTTRCSSSPPATTARTSTRTRSTRPSYTRLEHPRGGGVDRRRQARRLLQLRLDRRRRGGARRQHLLDLPRRRLQGAVRHLDGGALRGRRRRPAAQAGIRTPPTATCATRSATRSTSRRRSTNKVAYDGRLNAQKALAAIASIVN